MFRTYDISNFIYTFFWYFCKTKRTIQNILILHCFRAAGTRDLKYLFSCPELKCKNKYKKHKKYRHMIFG